VEVEGATVQVRVKELSAEDAAALWPRVLQIAPDYGRYLKRTDRAIPLLRLTPVGRVPGGQPPSAGAAASSPA